MLEDSGADALDRMHFPPETAEQAYRRGYRDGYAEAFNAVDQRGRREGIAQMLTGMLAFWQGALWRWQQAGETDKQRACPPLFRMPAQATRRRA